MILFKINEFFPKHRRHFPKISKIEDLFLHFGAGHPFSIHQICFKWKKSSILDNVNENFLQILAKIFLNHPPFLAQSKKNEIMDTLLFQLVSI